ncbi:MAG: LamG-like jellyroll fold domain-containing protein [Verrucomicrobiota bacterium JB024]|nr:LamG-like jellyroll fold domain-containing protein [Verrucomicrobiota bacterium JB024]
MKKSTPPTLLTTVLASLLLPAALAAETVMEWTFSSQTPGSLIQTATSTGSQQVPLTSPVAFEPEAVQTGETVSAGFTAAKRQMLLSEATDVLAFDANQPFTIELWFQYHSTSDSGRSMLSNRAFKSQDPAMPGITLMIRGTESSGARRVGAFIDFGDQDVFLTSSTPLEPDTWHHLAVRRDEKGRLDLVVDHKSVDSAKTTQNGPLHSPQPLFIGRTANSTSADGYFDGIIQAVRVSNAFIYAKDFLPNRAE